MENKLQKIHNRFLNKVKKSKSGCWDWQGALTFGYGKFWADAKMERAHRYSYEYFKGKIPKGLVLDHLCRNRKCVNPDHLEIVLHRENTRRGLSFAAINQNKTHCKNGHKLSGNNLRIRTRKRRNVMGIERICLSCKHINNIKPKKS